MDVGAEEQRRRDYGVWLRTGWWPVRAEAPVEHKYNGWHDTEDGRFTFVGQGRFVPRDSGFTGGGGGTSVGGGAGGSGGLRVDVPAGPKRDERRGPAAGGARDWFGGGFTGGGGGDFAGGGATGTWAPPGRLSKKPSFAGMPTGVLLLRRGNRAVAAVPTIVEQKPLSATPAKRVAAPKLHRIVEHKYTFDLDEQDRTRVASGNLYIDRSQGRSRASQRNAGGKDRRPGDHGGHYIGRQFGGPKGAFNHFAQNPRFNQVDYSKLETEWEKALRNGEKVTVRITSSYKGTSKRPSHIEVRYIVRGVEHVAQFTNKEAADGPR